MSWIGLSCSFSFSHIFGEEFIIVDYSPEPATSTWLIRLRSKHKFNSGFKCLKIYSAPPTNNFYWMGSAFTENVLLVSAPVIFRELEDARGGHREGKEKKETS